MKINQDNNFIADRTKTGRARYQLDGKPMTGVTTICGEHNKGWLVTWAAKEAYLDSRGRSSEEIDEIIKKKMWAHLQRSGSAKDKGTLAHDLVENFIKNYIEYGEYIPEEIEDEEISNSVNRFYTWSYDNEVEFLASEVSVYSREYWFAGSFDFICIIKDGVNSKTYLGDFKTSKQIDDTYFAQGAGYVIAVEENSKDIKFDGIIIVRSILAAEGNTWYEKSSNGTAKKMTNEVFEVVISTDLEREKTYFLSLLNLYRYRMGQQVGKWYKAPIVQFDDEDYPMELKN